VIRRCKECLSALQLSESLNQQFGEDSDFPCGVLTGRPHNEQAARRLGSTKPSDPLDTYLALMRAVTIGVFVIRSKADDPAAADQP
jgi:hypothetical protein